MYRRWSEFVHQRKQVIDEIYAQAVQRGEVVAAAINDDTYDLLTGYLVFRSVVSGRQPTRKTARCPSRG
jgi:Tetracyclin repressor-like, C-terminal domain